MGRVELEAGPASHQISLNAEWLSFLERGRRTTLPYLSGDCVAINTAQNYHYRAIMDGALAYLLLDNILFDVDLFTR